MDDVCTLARDLVGIPSHQDETAAGDHLEAWLRRETDATVDRDQSGNVLARRGSGPVDLALVGHHDVVPPDDSQVAADGYVVRERDGRLYGRGSADMKGAVAAAAVAFRDADPAGRVQFASFVGEETGGDGARAAIERGFDPAYAVVAEGSTGYSGSGVTDVVVTHRGRRGSTLTVGGTAAHASEPEAGENAVYHACEVVEDLRSVPTPETTVLGHQVTGSLTVTGIEGGTAWNIVPESCSITIDERTVPGERASIEAVATGDAVTWTVDQDLPPMACAEPAFAEAVLSAATLHQEADPERVTKPHATDAGWLAEAGTTCVVCGPAERGEAHTAEESVSLAVLDRCSRIYRTLLEEWPTDRSA